MKLRRSFAIALIPLLLLLLSQCRHVPGKVKLPGESIPFTLRYEGDEDVKWISVVGPHRLDSDPNTGVAIVWKMAPERYPRLSDLPPITYGQIPTGWHQEIPSNRAPQLENGRVYSISAITSRNHNVNTCVLIENGKALTFEGFEFCKPKTY